MVFSRRKNGQWENSRMLSNHQSNPEKTPASVLTSENVPSNFRRPRIACIAGSNGEEPPV